MTEPSRLKGNVVDFSKDHKSTVHDRMGRTESYPTNGTNPVTPPPPPDNYSLDRGEKQEENVMAAGRANLQQSV